MIAKGILAASAAAATFSAMVIVVAAPANAEDYWGAIAYSLKDGASGTSSQQANEADAKSAALFDCGNSGGSACEIVVTVQRPKCASLVASESLYSWGVDPDPVEAEKSAMADLGEPGSEVASTCGFIAGASPGALAPAGTSQAPTTWTHPHSPGPPAPAPVPAAPTNR